jgi:hypothetical protein
MFFDTYPEFVDKDVRKDRAVLQVTSESLSKRCASILPLNIVSGATILDLGSALGAMGHYGLTMGASRYTGVEIQQHYRNSSFELLGKYHTASSWNILETVTQVSGVYDVVLACGFLHGFIDIFGTIERVCKLSSKYVIIETTRPTIASFVKDSSVGYKNVGPSIVFIDNVTMVKNTGYYSNYSGVSSLANKEAIDLIMLLNGFHEDHDARPAPIIDSHDAYQENAGMHSRFITRYLKKLPMASLESSIKHDNLGIQ